MHDFLESPFIGVDRGEVVGNRAIRAADFFPAKRFAQSRVTSAKIVQVGDFGELQICFLRFKPGEAEQSFTTMSRSECRFITS